MAVDLGERFATALLARDWEGVKEVLDPAVELDADAGRITKLRILCSGPVPVGDR
jgi:hypothetical protein